MFAVVPGLQGVSAYNKQLWVFFGVTRWQATTQKVTEESGVEAQDEGRVHLWILGVDRANHLCFLVV